MPLSDFKGGGIFQFWAPEGQPRATNGRQVAAQLCCRGGAWAGDSDATGTSFCLAGDPLESPKLAHLSANCFRAGTHS